MKQEEPKTPEPKPARDTHSVFRYKCWDGKTVRRFRRHIGYSQRDLSSHFGMRQSAITYWEGKSNDEIKKHHQMGLEELANRLGVALERVFEFEEINQPTLDSQGNQKALPGLSKKVEQGDVLFSLLLTVEEIGSVMQMMKAFEGPITLESFIRLLRVVQAEVKPPKA